MTFQGRHPALNIAHSRDGQATSGVVICSADGMENTLVSCSKVPRRHTGIVCGVRYGAMLGVSGHMNVLRCQKLNYLLVSGYLQWQVITHDVSR